MYEYARAEDRVFNMSENRMTNESSIVNQIQHYIRVLLVLQTQYFPALID